MSRRVRKGVERMGRILRVRPQRIGSRREIWVRMLGRSRCMKRRVG